ncbi:MAG TPA: LemA family protein [Candidatus Paceibacterota bacterium]|nr:LemA family protein [Candidatus Paceibacterota bacterium]
MSPLYILGIILAVVILWIIFAYNRFIRLGFRADEAWSDIDVQLKRRYDLIPNLIETVKGYAAHERETFDRVTQARTAAMGAQTPGQHAQAENMLTGALKSLFAVAEAYPDLKANQNFLELQRELSDTENKIQAARRFYNGNVRDLNTAVQTFPGNIVAGMFSFKTREFFDLDESPAAREPVKVQFK